METMQAVREGLTFPDLTKGLVTVFVLVNFQRVSSPSDSPSRRRWQRIDYLSLAGFTFLFLFARSWLALVTRYAPEPYLDEFFHVPQAQAYCKGAYSHWDDKITTPPGLYLISLAYHKIWRLASCSTLSLRNTNVLAILQLALVASLCRKTIEAKLAEQKPGTSGPQSISVYALHTALNIALFPVLFFFSALYYTDIVSTLFVLLAYQNHLSRVRPVGIPSIFNGLWTIILGVASLMMRQTNIFWVVVYMGGAEAVYAVEHLKPARDTTPRFASLLAIARHYGWRYSLGDVHDPPVSYATVEDCIFCSISLGVAVFGNPIRVLRQIWPYLTLMALFVAFVVWNGGVVLGDKSNHIATLHLAQMLYIWPMFAFFSAPLLLPQALGIAWGIARRLMRYTSSSRTPKQSTNAVASPNGTRASHGTVNSSQPEAEHETRTFQRDKLATSPAPGPLQKTGALPAFEFMMQNHIAETLWLIWTNLASYFIVKYNTLIHPFTLADNRHYMFYIFRYTVLRSERVRWLLILPYALSRYFVWSCLEGCPMSLYGRPGPDCPGNMAGIGSEYINIPGRISELLPAREPSDQSSTQQSKVPARATAIATVKAPNFSSLLDSSSSSSALAPPTSTVLLWLLATTLSLITAPLVEPRYFILAWVFWRLLVPAWPAHECIPSSRSEAKLPDIPGLAWIYHVGKKLDVRLVLETLWFVAINLGSMYIFITKPFFWRAADGTLLDDGKVQRFMW